MMDRFEHAFKSANPMLALCGGNEGFMESGGHGYKSPLYGRRTSQIRLKPFDYRDAAHLLADKTPDEQVIYYAASTIASLSSSRSSHARVAPSPIKGLDIERAIERAVGRPYRAPAS